MKCQKCETPLQDSNAFCPECGSPRPTNHTCFHCGDPVIVKQKFCMSCGQCLHFCCQCGANLKPSQKFCHNCGQKVEVPAQKLTCTHCGLEVEETQNFCHNCGQKVEVPAQKLTCTRCGLEVEETQKFCSTCGTHVQSIPTPETPFCKSGSNGNHSKLGDNCNTEQQLPGDAQESQTSGASASREPVKTAEAKGETYEDAVSDETPMLDLPSPSNNKEQVTKPAEETSPGSTCDVKPSEQVAHLDLYDSKTESKETVPGASFGVQLSNSGMGIPDFQGSDKEIDKQNEETPSDTTSDVQPSELETPFFQNSDKQNKETPSDTTTTSGVQPSESELETPVLQGSDKQNEKTPSDTTTTSGVHPSELDTPVLQGSDKQNEETPSDTTSDVQPSELETPVLQSSDSDTTSGVQPSESELETPVLQGSDKQNKETPSDTTSGVQPSESELETPVLQGSDKQNKETPSDTTSGVQPSESELETPVLQGSDKQNKETPSDTTSDAQPLQPGKETFDEKRSAPSETTQIQDTAVNKQAEREDINVNEGATGMCELPDTGNSQMSENENSDFTDESCNNDDSEDLQTRGRSQSNQPKRRHSRKPSKRKRQKMKRLDLQKKKHFQEVAKETPYMVFHVVISKKFKQLKENNCRVFLSWKPNEKKPNPKDLVEMTFKEEKPECGKLYEVNFEVSKLTGNSPYKYCIELDGQYQWEKIYHNEGEESKTRHLHIRGQKGTISVYDWMAYPDGLTGFKDSVHQWIPWKASSHDTFCNDIRNALTLFLPSVDLIMETLCTKVDIHGQTAKDLLRMVTSITQRSPCFVKQNNWETLKSECIEEVLLTPLLERVKTVTNSDQKTVVLAMFLLHLADEMKIHLTPDNRIILTRALLIKSDLEKKTCPDLQNLMRHFPGLRKKQALLLSDLITGDPKDKNPSWIFCIPLLHLLSEDSKVFQPLPISDEHRTTRWWGTQNQMVEQKCQQIKNHSEHMDWPIPMKTMYQRLSDSKVFEADQLMQRTFVATLNLKQLLELLTEEVLPPEIVMASIFYHLNTNHRVRNSNHERKMVNILRKTATLMKAEVTSNRRTSTEEVQRWLMCAAMGADLLEEVIQKSRACSELIHSVMLLQLSFISVLTAGTTSEIGIGTANQVKNTELYLSQWLDTHQLNSMQWKLYIQMMEESIQASKEVPNEEVRKGLLEKLSENMRNNMDKQNGAKSQPLERLQVCLKLQEGGSCLNEIVAPHELQYLEDALNQMDLLKANSWFLGEHFYLREIINRLFKSRWNALYTSENGPLELVFSWRPLLIFMSILQSYPYFMEYLDVEVANYVQNCPVFLKRTVTKVLRGNIKIGVLEWLLQHREQSSEVVKNVYGDLEGYYLALCLREAELKNFQDICVDMNLALRLCQTFIETEDFCKICEEFRSEVQNKKRRFVQFCKNPAQPGSVSVDDYKPQICIPFIPERFQPFLNNLGKRQSSAVFCDMLKKCARTKNISPADKAWDVMVSVWLEAEDKWQTACQVMKSGMLTLEDAEKLFSMLEKNEQWFDKCREEVERMADEDRDRWVEKRMQQFQCLYELRTQKDAAAALCQIKEEFGFTGEVENIVTIQHIDMTQPIGDLDLSVVGASKALQYIDEKSVDCFKQFGSESCSKFVNWVRQTMGGDGMKEVKVFVDMAMNYVGDDPKEMDKVCNLRAVITGYAPLIFQAGELTFVDRCSLVARNIQADHALPTKLESSVGLVDWFDSIHKFHGSVEKTAMAQVDCITTTGILKIGRLHPHTKKGMDLRFNEVICLEVPEDGKTESKTYSYQDLVDLQSRLMLVVRQEDKSKSSIERFISVMDSVERLVKTYIKLCREGCLLFLNWAVKFFFDVRGVCCIVEFFQGEVAKKLKGRQESCTLEDYMAKVACFLDMSLESWQNYIAKQRKDCNYLNVFTMDQLVFLQEQLALPEKSCDVSSHVFPLLSLLLPESCPDHLHAAMKQAAETLNAQKETETEDDEKDIGKEAEAAAIFIQHMQDNGFDKKLALRALKADVSPTDLNKGLDWCVTHADDEDGEEENEAINSESLSSPHLDGMIANALQLLDMHSETQVSLEMLERSLTDTWNQFLNRVTFSGEDYLSLQHLGSILRALTEMENTKYNRRLPPPMKSGVPNLIICPKSEVLKTVTSLYMFTKEAALPQPDEVLLCTPHTTKEEVEMFLQRVFSAFSSHMEKIYCLAFADSLDYDVGEYAEKYIKEFTNTAQHPYQLVVVCTSENEFNARITASLERFSRPPPITAADTDEILNYLTCKFTVPDSVLPRQSAACVDPDRLCVRVVKSARSGMGKTLYKKRLVDKLKVLLREDDSNNSGNSTENSDEDSDTDEDSNVGEFIGQLVDVTVPLNEKHVDSHNVADILLHRLPPAPSSNTLARLIHLDIAYEVQDGVDLLLYNLLVLGCITDVHGQVWRRLPSDLYLVEAMPLLEHSETQEKKLMHQIFSILPSLRCSSPSESLLILENKKEGGHRDLLFDAEECESTVFQRPIHYLNSLSRRGDPQPFGGQATGVAQNQKLASCLKILLRHCGVENPSWSEVYHFVSFLNKQLEDFEHSVFCRSDLSQDLPGFPAFVLKFLIHMSRDFATRSIVMAEEALPVLSISTDNEEREEMYKRDELQQYQMRRTWESSPHPYIFFNPDQSSMTFLGFTMDRFTGSLMDQTGGVLEKSIMKRTLYDTLVANEVPLTEDFNCLPRHKKLQRLYQVMGVPASEMNVDPDSTYELTTDNAKKILAIYMRFRCNIPVVIMGETGCGKTRLVKFLCALQNPTARSANLMVIMKVHGGTTAEDIHKKVREAEAIAKATKEYAEQNSEAGTPRPIYTVLFFDEANTTEAIGAIKEVMCDGAMNGMPIKLHQNLKMVAACNPYRRHSEAVMNRLEKAGLGYHVSAEKTCDKLGRVPMRQLVYRVQPLPQSMLPLVWDFGQLDTKTERLYIRQMVLHYGQKQFRDLSPDDSETLCDILVKAQTFMRNLKDECSFVSLRDVERTLMVTSWFLQQTKLLSKITKKPWDSVGDITKSLVLALAVCYRASLLDKSTFDTNICRALHSSFCLPEGPKDFECIIDRCQAVLLDDVELGEKIACNQALKENVFMMVVCIDLRIPLFLVGKPGSSKSLAKAIVADAMQGTEATGELFKTFKETQMVSFQCSPLATADGILGTFRQCAHIQHGKERDKFVAVAVLDEIGLAEDSPKMPLKALHPLLEEGYEIEENVESDKEETDDKHEDLEPLLYSPETELLQGFDADPADSSIEEDDIISEFGDEEVNFEMDFDPEEDQHEQQPCRANVYSKQTRTEKVAFIGISNWALDPAKMNRGILVQRDVPDLEELINTAKSICKSGQGWVLQLVESLVKKLAEAYLAVFLKATQRREFFGLRDFYSLVKMVHAIATHKKRKLTRDEFKAAVRRNFGGLENVDPVKIFEEKLALNDTHCDTVEGGIDSSYAGLLKMAVQGDEWSGESRYLLLLTENYGGLHILTNNLLADQSVELIFGSSFPRDQEYTQICRNINHIKICMETGKTVVLLNLDNLYESLYDALNQYYSYLANSRYVDLGLGTHRVKCKVDTNFRLIVVAEKQTVYEKFPIPLINRLEKHFLTVNNLLSDEQHRLQGKLVEWMDTVALQGTGCNLAVSDVFIGYHEDMAASTVLQAWSSHIPSGNTLTPATKQQILQDCKKILLWCATPDAVIRLQDEWCTEEYFCQQQHDSLAQYLQTQLQDTKDGDCFMAQVTTHSKLLTDQEKLDLEQQLPRFSFTLMSLQAFHTEQQFIHKIRLFVSEDSKQAKVLVVQCDKGNLNQDLLQCAQYCVQSLWSSRDCNHHIVFIIQLPRVLSAAFSGFMGGIWHCAHVDDLRSPTIAAPSMVELQLTNPAQLLSSALLPASNKEKHLPGEEIPDGSPNVSLNPDLACHMLRTCVQNAVAMIRDSNKASSRSTVRIRLLLQSMESCEDNLFFTGVLRMVSSVLQEKEIADIHSRDLHQWLSCKAANPAQIKKAGTMRRAWMQCLEDLMVPILAGVVAYLDTNHNLDLLNGDTWVQQLWLKVLNDPELCGIRCLDLMTMSGQQTQLKEFVCQSTFQAHDSVSAAFPFSWVIANMINTFLTNTPVSENDYKRESAAIDALAKSAVDGHLQEIVTNDDIAEQCVQCYLADLLHVGFRLGPRQHELLMQCVTAAQKQEGLTVQKFTVIPAMVKMHSILTAVRPRLQAVLDMAACHPQAIQNLQERRHDPHVFDPEHQSELVEDILLLEILINELKGQQNQLNTEEGCRGWLDHYNKVAPVMSRVLEDADHHISTAATFTGLEYTEVDHRKPWLKYGPWCCEHFASIKCTWTRICVVKLFIDYMSPLVEGSDKVQVNPINYNLLWNLLQETANLKSKDTLVKVDKYLKLANSQMVKKLLGNVGECTHCQIKLEGPPTALPCTHRICDKCYRQEVTTSHQCPECHNPVPSDFSPETFTGYDQGAVDELLLFQRQTSAFLMAVVSQLSFAGQEPPEPEAVEHIFSYIIRRVDGVATVQTQKLTLRNDQMDASPVLRSFILRLLLKYSWDEVSAYITRFLEDAKSVIQDHVEEQTQQSNAVLVELSLLIIHCTESLEYEAMVIAGGQETDVNLSGFCQEVKEQLHCVRKEMEESPLELQTLTAIGKLRHALTCCANLLYTHVIEPTDWEGLGPDLKDLFIEVFAMCIFVRSDWPRDFLVKQLCRNFGVEAYCRLVQRASTERCLQWIKLDNVKMSEEVVDRYLMCGSDYRTLRDEIRKEMRGQSSQLLMRLSELRCRDETKSYLLLLTLHREGHMAFVTTSRQAQAGAQDKAMHLAQSRRIHIDEAFAKQLVNNSLCIAGSALRVSRDQCLADQSLACVLIHLWVALRTQQQPRHLLAPLVALINHPEQMKSSFLPTMPQDNVSEIIQALGIDHSKTLANYERGQETAKVWECPKGHRYIIGDCGNPNQRGRCPECQSGIGAQSYHRALDGNKLAQLTDRTRTGHILGAAKDRITEALPERRMSAAACALLRFLTHAALYISACQPDQMAVVTELIQPPVREADVPQFFREHLDKDLKVLQHVLGRCFDDVCLLLHYLCHQLHISTPDFYWNPLLQSKQMREDWENRFTAKYIQPVLEQTDDIIRQGTDLLLSDTRQDENQLLNLVFEVGDEDSGSGNKLQHTAAPWKYRTRITVDHFFRQFQLLNQGNNQTLHVLRLFLDESHHLRALHFLPDILDLQRRLLQKLRHRLTRVDVTKTSVKDKQACTADGGKIVHLPEEWQTVSINDGSPIGVLLPDTEGPGCCAFLLVHYLLVQHNHFMMRYCPHTRYKFEELPEVPLNMITRHHLVSYSPQTDLLPLVLAHCSYSLHLGHGDSATATKLDYDFQGFELQLRNTLLLGKSRVHRGPNGEIEIETMSYCADTTNSRLINRLREKVAQEELEVRVQHQIITEFHDNLADICQSIDDINTTLTFLLTLKVTGDQLLNDFMVNTLQMKGLQHSRKAQQYCQVKHIQSLWLLLCLKRARILASHNQEAFDNQGADLRKELTEKQVDDLDSTLRRMTPDCLELLLTQIYQCITLSLIGHSHDQDFANPDNYSLKYLMEDAVEYPVYSLRGINNKLTAADLETFPESVMASQTIPAWTHILMHLSQRHH